MLIKIYLVKLYVDFFWEYFFLNIRVFYWKVCINIENNNLEVF